MTSGVQGHDFVTFYGGLVRKDNQHVWLRVKLHDGAPLTVLAWIRAYQIHLTGNNRI